MPRIFDNINLQLLPALRQTLELSHRADFSVGYFNLRGWRGLGDQVDAWAGGDGQQCRVLIGMQRTPDEEIHTLYSLASSDNGIDQQEVIRLKRKLADEFRSQLTIGAPTNEDEAGLRRLRQQLMTNKVVVKLFLRHTLHAKLYLAYRDDPNNPMIGFVGSSNLTMAGLSKQGELNVDVLDHDACEKLRQWFEDRWSDKWCLDITEELADLIEESWAREDVIPPYHIYLKMAYHLSREAQTAISEFSIPRDFGQKLFEFQVKAVQIGAHHVNRREGVLIGDVVGLGKTLMATALARIMQDDHGFETLIICPKNLTKMWQEDYVDRYRLVAKVMPITRVQRELPDLRRYRLIVIDESHNLRNREGKRYRAIVDYIDKNDSKCILLSATPYNKTYLDLGAQLADIDFNVRTGNTLIGFAAYEDVERAIKSKFDFDSALERVSVKAADLQLAFDAFRERQVEGDGSVPPKDKAELRKRLVELDEELNQYLAQEYGFQPGTADYDQWKGSCMPFHWFVEFYGIMHDGGFDVIIGNPPYVELNAVDGYDPRGYSTEASGNLYALFLERSSQLGHRQGLQGFIVPVSSVSTDRYETLQHLLVARTDRFCSFDDRPSRLFDGLEHIRLTIHLMGGGSVGAPTLFSTRYNKWSSDERPNLFAKLSYTNTAPVVVEGTLPKLSSPLEFSLIEKLLAQQRRLGEFHNRLGGNSIFYSRKVGYFLQVLDFEPLVLDGRQQRRPPSEFKELRFREGEHAKIALCCLNSNLFVWFITVFSDCRHVNKREVDAFPVNLETLASSSSNRLSRLARSLMDDLRTNSETRTMRFRHDSLTVQCIFPGLSKHVIDDIDTVLARHYGFTEEELDFIINYDIKYRMGGVDEDGDG